MTPQEWQAIKGHLYAALELDPAARSAYLEQLASQHPEVSAELEALVGSYSGMADDFLSAPEIDKQAGSMSGRQLGPYQIVARIGSGGMGEVYRAVRADGTYEKQVAIKLIQSGLNTDYFLDRFTSERQILASLDHPNIARLIDGGSTQEGFPYVVMEYIDGQPIDQYCEQSGFDIPERLKLFCAVCSAVQYAHKNLVVHRDLKPANILVTEDGVPKLLDFGIAKVLHPQQNLQNSPTQTLLPLLTPEYASPEQVRNENITTSCDVYSLGVILYVLLTGHHPYKTKDAAPHELIRAICETAPEKPSIAVTRFDRSNLKKSHASAAQSVFVRGAAETKRLRRVLAGDLDNIILKALRKEPERRFSSVEHFSEDIRRHLAHLPVLAHKDTLAYRLGKFARRNELGVSTVAVIILFLLVSHIDKMRHDRIAQLERAREERRFKDVRALANSLIFEVHDSIRDLPGATSARKIILQRAQEYLDRLSADSQSDPALQREAAAAYSRLGELLGSGVETNAGDMQQSILDLRRAVELRKEVVAASPSPDTRRELAESYMALALTLSQNRKNTSDEDYLEAALSILQPLAASNPNDLKIQNALVKALERKAQSLSAQ